MAGMLLRAVNEAAAEVAPGHLSYISGLAATMLSEQGFARENLTAFLLGPASRPPFSPGVVSEAVACELTSPLSAASV